MESRKGKIGINTTMIVYLLCCYSPFVRLIGSYTSVQAKQAAWMSPLVACLVLYCLLANLYTLLASNPGLSLMEVYEKTIGKVLTKIISSTYLIWIILMIGVNIRAYTFRLKTTLYPNISETFFIAVPLLLTGPLFLKSGLVISSRMFKVFYWILIVGSIILFGLIMPNVSIANLTPISYLDAIPVIKASVSIISIFSLFTVFMIFSDDMIGIKDLKKKSFKLIAFFLVAVTLLLICMIGVLGESILEKASFPFLIVVEQIQILNSIQGFESLLTVLWIMSDYALITWLSFSCLKLMKYIFNLKDASMFINIFMLMLFYISMITANNYFNLREFTYKYIYVVDIFLYVVIPIMVSLLYKMRTKAQKALTKNKKKQA